MALMPNFPTFLIKLKEKSVVMRFLDFLSTDFHIFTEPSFSLSFLIFLPPLHAIAFVIVSLKLLIPNVIEVSFFIEGHFQIRRSLLNNFTLLIIDWGVVHLRISIALPSELSIIIVMSPLQDAISIFILNLFDLAIIIVTNLWQLIARDVRFKANYVSSEVIVKCLTFLEATPIKMLRIVSGGLDLAILKKVNIFYLPPIFVLYDSFQRTILVVKFFFN